MPGDEFKKAMPGQPFQFPAAVWNEMIDVLRWARTQRGSGKNQVAQLVRNSTIVRIKNTSGADRDRFHVLGLGAPTIDAATDAVSFKYDPTITGETPLVSTHVGRFGVLLEPIKNNEFGRAVIAGITPAIINVASDKAMKFADIEDSQPGRLQLLPYGAAELLWRETGSGASKWGLVRIGPMGPAGCLAKTTASVTKNTLPGGNNAEFYFGTAASETASGINFKTVCKWANVSSGKWIWVTWNGHYWYITAAEC